EGRARAAQIVVVIGVDHRLVVHRRVDRGDRHILQANRLVQHLEQRHATVSGAGGVRDQAFLSGQAGVVDAIHQRGVDVRLAGHGLGKQHTWRAGVEETLAVGTGVVDAGAFEHQVDAQTLPVDGFRGVLTQHLHAGAVQVQAVAVDPHFTWKTPMGGVEAGQVFDAGLIGQVVERDDVQIALATLIQGAQHATADAAVTVEGNFVGTILGHLGLPGYTPLEGRRLEAGRKSSSVPPAVHPPAYRLQRLSVFEKFFSSAEYVVDSEAEHLEQLIGRSRFTEGAHADDAAFQADVLVPEVGVRGFDGNARGNFHRQYGLLVGGVLGVEHSGRRH